MNLFGPLHWGLLVVSALCVAGAASARPLPGLYDLRRRRMAALFLIALELGWNLYCKIALGVPLSQNLPLHLCDFGQICLIVHLWRPNAFTRSMLPFFGIPGVVLALALPTITEPGWAAYASIARYFIAHTATLAGAMRILAREGASLRGALRAFGVFVVVSVPVSLLNLMLGENYSYTLRRPQSAAFLDEIPSAIYPILYYPTILLFFVATAVLSGACRSRRQRAD